MKRAEFEKIVNEQCEIIKRMLLVEKCQEYSPGVYCDDSLIHFKDMERLEHRHPLMTCKTYYLRQILSLNSQIEAWDNLTGIPAALLSPPKLLNRIDDAINYLILAKAIIHEEMEGECSEQNKNTTSKESS